MSRELDEACARALGMEGAVNGRPVWFVPGHTHAMLAPPAFSTDPATTPLLLAEIARRGPRAVERYVDALNKILFPDDQASIFVSAIEIDHTTDGHTVLWTFLTATPEQHARAFLAAIA